MSKSCTCRESYVKNLPYKVWLEKIIGKNYVYRWRCWEIIISKLCWKSYHLIVIWNKLHMYISYNFLKIEKSWRKKLLKKPKQMFICTWKTKWSGSSEEAGMGTWPEATEKGKFNICPRSFASPNPGACSLISRRQ